MIVQGQVKSPDLSEGDAQMEDTSTAPSEQKIVAGQYVRHLDPPVSDGEKVEQSISEPAASPETLTGSSLSPQEAFRLFKIRAYWYKKHLRCTKKKVRYDCR